MMGITLRPATNSGKRNFEAPSARDSFRCPPPRKLADCPPTAVKTLHTYLIRQVITSLLMTVVVFTFVLLLGNVLKEILGLLVNRQATFGVVLESVGLLIPFVWVFALPMAMLTATLLVFGRFSADQELTAVRAGGISLLSLVSPILLLSLFLCGVSAWVNLDIAPRCRVAYRNLIDGLKVELLTTVQLPEGRYIKDFPGYIFYVGRNRRGELEDVMVFELKKGTNLVTTVLAPRGRMEVDPTNRVIVIRLFDAKSVKFQGDQTLISSGDVIQTFTLGEAKKPSGRPNISDMTFLQLQEELQYLEQEIARPLTLTNAGPATTKRQRRDMERQLQDLALPVRVQMHRQVAISFACFGFTLIGIPLGIRVHRRETNIGFAMALVLVFVYYSFVLVGLALSTRPEFAPHLIVWLPNIIFQAVGAVLLWRANKGI